jgi:cardiolipin synthase
MRLPALCLFLLLVVAQASAFEIVEFCPDTYLQGEADEYLVLEGGGSTADVRISDGEGSVRFPDSTAVTGRTLIARTASGYAATFGIMPDYEIFDSSPSVPDMVRTGDLRMANSGDDLILIENGREIQRIRWPDEVTPREGQIHYFEGGIWDPRPLLIGQSRFTPATFEETRVTAFVAPDCSSDAVTGIIGSAEDRILANVYEFTDPAIAGAMAGAAERGVEVRVLLEGGPVGGIPAEEGPVIARLTAAGASVAMMTTTERAHAKYRYDHAKYLVIDDAGVMITSENFKPGGFPPCGTTGNRGWGVYLEHPGLAAYFAEVFFWDAAGGDIVPAVPGNGENEAYDASEYVLEFAPATFEGATVTPVLSPDTSGLVRELLAGARSTIVIEQAYISNWSEDAPNPYVEAALDAARRGVTVRILLDNYWFNTEGEDDNDEMAAWLNTVAAREQIPLEARCADLRANGLVKIHNKGAVVDGERTLISSINWNENSPCFNREAGVIIDHADCAAYFTSVFEDDWKAAAGEPGEDDGRRQKWGAAAGAVILLLALYLRKRRG